MLVCIVLLRTKRYRAFYVICRADRGRKVSSCVVARGTVLRDVARYPAVRPCRCRAVRRCLVLLGIKLLGAARHSASSFLSVRHHAAKCC